MAGQALGEPEPEPGRARDPARAEDGRAARDPEPVGAPCTRPSNAVTRSAAYLSGLPAPPGGRPPCRKIGRAAGRGVTTAVPVRPASTTTVSRPQPRPGPDHRSATTRSSPSACRAGRRARAVRRQRRPPGPLGWALLASAPQCPWCGGAAVRCPCCWRFGLRAPTTPSTTPTPHRSPRLAGRLYTVAATGRGRPDTARRCRRPRPALIVSSATRTRALELLRISGWIFAVLVHGCDVRVLPPTTSPPSSSAPNGPNGPARRRPAAASRRNGCGSPVTCTTCSPTASP